MCYKCCVVNKTLNKPGSLIFMEAIMADSTTVNKNYSMGQREKKEKKTLINNT